MKIQIKMIKTAMSLKPFISVNKATNNNPRRNLRLSTVFLKLLSVKLLFSLMIMQIPIAFLAQCDNAYAADKKHWTEEARDELKAKLEEKIKDGLSADDVKEITGHLQDLVGDELDGTGVGELLGAMNTHAGNVTKVKDYADKLESTIDLVDKVMEAKESGDGEAMMEALAAGVTLAGEFAGEVPVIGKLIQPMLKAYGQAIENGATDVAAMQAAHNRAIEIIAATKIGAGDESEAEGDAEEEEFSWGASYPYCPECGLELWMAGNAESRLNDAKLKGQKIDDELKSLEADKAAGKTVALYAGALVPIDEAIDSMEYQQGAADAAIDKAQKQFDAMHQALIDKLEESVKTAEQDEPEIGILGDIYNKIFSSLTIGATIGAVALLELPTEVEQSFIDAGVLQTDANGNPDRENPPELDAVMADSAPNDVEEIWQGPYDGPDGFSVPKPAFMYGKPLAFFQGDFFVDIFFSDYGAALSAAESFREYRRNDPDSITDNAEDILNEAGMETTTVSNAAAGGTTSDAEQTVEEVLAEIGQVAHSGGLGHCVSGAHHNSSVHTECLSNPADQPGDQQ